MQIEKIESGLNIEQIEQYLCDANKQTISCTNWPLKYPYCPSVTFAMLHDGDCIYLKYWVDEKATLAIVDKDFGEIWTDSCVEFFVSFGTGYYNLEFNSIGYGLASYRTNRDNSENVSQELMSKIERYPSLPCETFSECKKEPWSLLLKIPKEVFFKESITSLSGIKATANFYKCGDNLKESHFVSWSRIHNPMPNFHIPFFFDTINFKSE